MRSFAELAPKVSVKRIDPDGLFGKQSLVLDIELAAPFGFTEEDPIRCFVARAAEARCFDEGLDQDWAMVVALLPVISESPGRHAQDP